MTSDEIECLVNAYNPKYDGATSYYKGGEIQILEVAPVDNPTPISQNSALFAILGTSYGGDGSVNFELPDLRGRVSNY